MRSAELYSSLLVVIVFAAVLYWRHVRLLRRYAIAIDEISELRRCSTNDQGNLNEIKQRYTLTEAFVATVSHELRTPLTSIRASLGMLAAGTIGTVDQTALRLITIASTNTERVVRLLDRVLDLERLQSGADTLLLRACTVTELCGYAMESMTPLAQVQDISLQLDESPNTQSAIVEADFDRIVQVLCNLLSNAIKFSPSGSTISLIASANISQLVFRVTDSGRGIPADKLEAIFERFGQAEVDDSRKKGGAGLGLAICKEIVHQHRGSIRAENNVSNGANQRGATFVVVLPLKAASPKIDAANHPSE